MEEKELMNDGAEIVTENAETEPIYVSLTDTDGVEHSYQLLSIFNAGNLNREYGALLSQDVILYRYFLNDGRECGEEIAEADFAPVSAHWGAMADKLNKEQIREGSLYLLDTELNEYVPCAGTILSVFTTPFGGEFVAFVPHSIHFYRYEETEKEDGSFEVTWESIVSAHEYDDVVTEFDKLLEN